MMPWRPLLAKLLFLVFVAELTVMVLMDRLPKGFLKGGWLEALADALLLTLCTAPFFWALLVRPLRRAALIEKTKSDVIREQIVDAILTYDRRGIITSCNPAATRTFHYTAEEMVGRRIGSLVPELEGRVMPGVNGDSYRLHDDSPTAYGHSVNGIRKGDVMFSLEISVSRVELGEEKMFLAILRDITERKRSEMVMQESREKFRSLSESAPVGIFLTDTAGICTYVNARWQDITGLTSAQSIGKPWTATIHHEDKKKVEAAWSRYLASGEGFKEEFRFSLSYDEVRWVATHIAAMSAGTGEIIGYVGAVADNTERKLAEQGQHKFNILLTATLESTADAVFMADGHGQVQIFNQKFVDTFDIPAAILERKDCQLILAFIGEQVAEPDDFINRITELNSGEEPATLVGIKLNDGRQLDIYCQPFWLDEGKSGRVWSFRTAGKGPV